MCSMPMTWSSVAAIHGQAAERAGGGDPRARRQTASRCRWPRAARAAPSAGCAVRRPRRSARCRRTCSCGSSRPPSRLSAISSSISSGECTWRWPVDGTRSRRSSSAPLPLRKRSTSENRRSDHCIGRTVQIAVRGRVLQGERLRHQLADDHREHGQTSRTIAAAVDCAVAGSRPATDCEQRRERRRHRRLPVGAKDQAGEGDADLRDRDVAIELVRVLDHRQDARGQGVAILRQAPQAAAASADGRELRGHVQARQEDQKEDDERCHQHRAWRSYPNRPSSTVFGRSACPVRHPLEELWLPALAGRLWLS